MTTFHQKQDVKNTGMKLPCISISLYLYYLFPSSSSHCYVKSYEVTK